MTELTYSEYKASTHRLSRGIELFKLIAYDLTCQKCIVRYPPYVLSFHHTGHTKNYEPSALLRKTLTSGNAELWTGEANNLKLVCRNCHATHHQAEWVLENGQVRKGDKLNKRALRRQAIKRIFADAGGMMLSNTLTPASLQFHHTRFKDHRVSELLGRVSKSERWLKEWVSECVNGGLVMLSANAHITLHKTNIIPEHVGPFSRNLTEHLTQLAIKEYKSYLHPYGKEHLISDYVTQYPYERWQDVVNVVRRDVGYAQNSG